MPPKKSNETGTSAATSASKQISWAGSKDIALASLLRDNWEKYQSSGGKIEFCREWAKTIGIGEQDETGYKTKAHIKNLFNSYHRAKAVLEKTGAGTIQKEVRKGDKKVMVYITLDEQVKAICPIFDILHEIMQRRGAVVLGEGVGLGINGLLTSLSYPDNSYGRNEEPELEAVESEEPVLPPPSATSQLSIIPSLLTTPQPRLGLPLLLTIPQPQLPVMPQPQFELPSISTIPQLPLPPLLTPPQPSLPPLLTPPQPQLPEINLNINSQLHDGPGLDLTDSFDLPQLNESICIKGKRIKYKGKRGRKSTEPDSDIEGLEDSLEEQVRSPIKQIKLAPGGRNKIAPKGKNVNDGIQFIQNLWQETRSSREHRQKMAELRLKARLAKVGGGTEEQRAHELQLLQLRNENAIRLKELDLEKVKLELELEAGRRLEYRSSTSKSPRACCEHSGFTTVAPDASGGESEPKTSNDELQVGASKNILRAPLSFLQYIKNEDERREIPCFSNTLNDPIVLD